MKFLKNNWLTILVFIIAAVTLCIGLNSRSFWTDEWYAFKYFDFSFIEFFKDYWAHPDNHPPGYYLIVMAFVKLLGRHDWAVRLPSVLGGLGAVFMSWLIAKRMLIPPLYKGGQGGVKRSFGPLAVVLIVSSAPYLLTLAQTARYFSLCAFVALFVVYSLIRIIETPPSSPPLTKGGIKGGWFVWHALALAAAGYLDYPTFIYVGFSSALIMLVWSIRRKAWGRLLSWIGSMVGVGILMIPLVPIALTEAVAEGAYRSDVLASGFLAWLVRFGIHDYVSVYGVTSFPWNWEVTVPWLAFIALFMALMLQNGGRAIEFFKRPAVMIGMAVMFVGFMLNLVLLSVLDRYSPLSFPRYDSFVLYLGFILLVALIWVITRQQKSIRWVMVVLLLFVHAVGIVHYARADRFVDSVFFTQDRKLYEIVRDESKPGDYIWMNEDFTRRAYDWYKNNYFADVEIFDSMEIQDFLTKNPSVRIWVLGYGYDDPGESREPRHKAELLINEFEEGTVQIAEQWFAGEVDSRYQSVKQRLLGHPSYIHKTGLFLVTMSDES